MKYDRVSWRKSSYSNGDGGACVEVTALNDDRAVRDSKDPAGSVLECTAAEWTAFTTAVRSGEFN